MIVTIAFLGLAFGLGAVPDQPSPDDPPQAKTSPDGDPLADARAATDRQDWDVAAQRFRSWRRLLGAQRDLLQGQGNLALSAMDSLANDFPDLDQDSRLDLLLKTTYILRSSGRADRARELLQTELARATDRHEDQVESLLDEVGEAFGDDHITDFLSVLSRLSHDLKTPVMVRVSARDRHVDALREDERPDQAEAILRGALTTESAEFPRCRAAMKLAEILADDLEKRDEAAKLLDQVRSNLKRRDLVNQLREAADEYRKPDEPGDQ